MITEILNHLWQSTVFVAVMWLLAFALRNNRARRRHDLWMLASIKFLIPFSVLASAGGQLKWRIVPAAGQQLSFVIDEIARPFASPAEGPC